MNKSDKKIVFSEKIDNAINGFAIGLTFLGIAVFLALKPNYFGLPIISYIISALMGILGFGGTWLELSKIVKIKGMGMFVTGCIFIATWLVVYIEFDFWISNIISFISLILGAYCACTGLFQGIYSIFDNIKNNKKNGQKSNIISQIILFATQVCGLFIAVVNVIKIFST